jgi:TolB-like protein
VKPFLAELKRRKVVRVAIVYVVVGLVVAEAANNLLPALNLPDWTVTLVVALTLLGFPVAVALAWAFDITPEGVKRTEPLGEGAARPGPGNRAIAAAAAIVVLVLAVAVAWLVIRDGGPTPSTDTKSIAVLPFDNLSPDPEADEYFAEGVHDEIIAYLSMIGELRVTSRTSVMRYKDTDMSLRDIAAELDVATILEGAVRRAEGRVRITAQLIDAQTDEHIWTETYERDYAGIFAIQVDVAEQIAAALRVTLTPEAEQRIQQIPTESLAAYDLYLRGRYFWNRRSKDDFDRAIEHFEGAIAEDPGYAQAYAGLADTYNLLAVDPNVAEAYTCLAHIHTWYDWSWSDAAAGFERALSLDPNYATARHWYSMYLMAQGQPDEALAEARRAVELDPLSVFLRNHLARYLFVQGRYAESIEALNTAAEMDPRIGNPHSWLFLIYSLQGRHDEAVEALKVSRELSGATPAELESLQRTYAESGWADVVVLQIARLTESYRAESAAGKRLGTREMGGDQGQPILIAQLYTLLGRSDEAFEWLDVALQERRIGLHTLRHTPIWEGLRSDPRYEAALRRMGLED